jgi:hypothetical protein
LCLPRAASGQRRRGPLSDISISPWVARIPASREILSRHFASWIALHWLWQGFRDTRLSRHRLLRLVHSNCHADHADLATRQSMPHSLLTVTAGFRDSFRYVLNEQRKFAFGAPVQAGANLNWRRWLRTMSADGMAPLSPGNKSTCRMRSRLAVRAYTHTASQRDRGLTSRVDGRHNMCRSATGRTRG